MPYITRQYESAKSFAAQSNQLGNIVDSHDAARLSAYNLYEDFYYNRPQSFRITKRADTDVEIYLPSAKKIVNASARFLAVDFDFTTKGGEASVIDNLMRNIWKREELKRRQIKAKKSMLMRGDVVWHVTADSSKPAGKRLTINTIHPSSYFPIESPDDAMRVIGCHLVDLVKDPREKTRTDKLVARRQTYRKEPNGQISSEAALFELGAWDDRNLEPSDIKRVAVLRPKTLLAQSITTIPVYHIANDEPDGSNWGTSQIAGIEYLINALNQSMTYEDLTLVLQGLGVYVSTAGPPLRSDGKPGTYPLHPGNVIEISPDDNFQRVSGVSSVAPFQEHIKLLDTWALQGAGVPEMATGIVDVSVAQSGIALSLKMGPIIAENADKELAIQGKWEQLGFDLINGWFPAFEGINSPETEFSVTFGDAMPIDRKARVDEIVGLYQADLILIDEARAELEDLGYPYSKALTDKLIEQQQRKSQAAMGDPYAGELGSGATDLMDEISNPDLRVVK